MNIKLKAYQLRKKFSNSIFRKPTVQLFIVLTIILALFYFYAPDGSINIKTNHIIQPKQSSFKNEIAVSRVNATFVILVRNSDLSELKTTLKNLERQFNKQYQYPYVLLNDVPFTEQFKKEIKLLTDSKVEFGTIPTNHWQIPNWIDKDKAKNDRLKMEKDGVIYGGSLSYRHMCRYESGFFFRHNLTLKYKYYWRVEPGVSFNCKIDFDPFRVMYENKKRYGFVISLYEFEKTIPTLWSTTKEYLSNNKQWDSLPKDNALDFISNDKGKTYNLCHFWSNFEIAEFSLWRSKSYLDYFDHLDKKGGFFYERWGDAPVHSIYAALFLKKEEIHFFNKIAYTHPPYSHCPIEPELNKKCFCDPKSNFDYDGYSCTKQWFDLVGHK